MSKTEIVTSTNSGRIRKGIQFIRENVRNEMDRHCRIGKVTEKRPRHYGPPTPHPMIPVPPQSPWFPGPYDLPPMYPLGLQGSTKCSCKPGSACNNIACPHRLIVTSGVEFGRYNEMTTANRLGLDAYGA